MPLVLSDRNKMLQQHKPRPCQKSFSEEANNTKIICEEKKADRSDISKLRFYSDNIKHEKWQTYGLFLSPTTTTLIFGL